MYMAYTKNPHIPRVRMDAVKLIRAGWSYRKVARHTGYTIGTLSKWVKKADRLGRNQLWIPTESSRPKVSPRALPTETVQAIIEERLEHNRCADVVYHQLVQDGIEVSLSSVKRTLDRQHLLKKRSPWKRPHDATPRPDVVNPGDLVELDTIHVVLPKRLYIYTLLDVFTRWAFAEVAETIRVKNSLLFIRHAQTAAPFFFSMLQSDHGSEFSHGFTLNVGTAHRHTRVRKPNDNAHIERFNRTLQEECLNRVPASLLQYQRVLPDYLRYYNTERMHLSLNFKSPLERFQGLDS